MGYQDVTSSGAPEYFSHGKRLGVVDEIKTTEDSPMVLLGYDEFEGTGKWLNDNRMVWRTTDTG